MRNYHATVRFNARVLDERTPPGYFDAMEGLESPRPRALPESGIDMAFSRSAGPVLDAARVLVSPGAGGVAARIHPSGLQRIRNTGQESALDFVDAVEQAYEGWARNRYVWKLGEERSIVLGGRPKLMGVLNVTPDSFSDGGRYNRFDTALRHAEEMIDAGAALIDVGGESSRPGSESVDVAEELKRTIPVVKALAGRTDLPISIDTTKEEVARAALQAGASIINDISGMTYDSRMRRLAAESKAGVVLMHIKGTPRDMQDDPRYGDTLAEVSMTLRERLLGALDAGVESERIVLDPGIGFGKRYEDNLRLLGSIGEMRSLGFPLLIGSSRKSILGRISGRDPRERTFESATASVVAALAGVQILRVHDIPENLRCLMVAQSILDIGRRRDD